MKKAFSIIGIVVCLAITVVGVLTLTGTFSEKLLAPDENNYKTDNYTSHSGSSYSSYSKSSYSPHTGMNWYDEGYAAFGGDFYTYVNNNAAKAAFYAKDAANYAKDAAGYAKDTAHYAEDAAGYAEDAAHYAENTARYAKDLAVNSELMASNMIGVYNMTNRMMSFLMIALGLFGICLFATFLGKNTPIYVTVPALQTEATQPTVQEPTAITSEEKTEQVTA